MAAIRKIKGSLVNVDSAVYVGEETYLFYDIVTGCLRMYDGTPGGKPICGGGASGSSIEVLEFANLASFPATGEAGIIYVALDTNLLYRWDGAAYVGVGGASGSTFGSEFQTATASGVTSTTSTAFLNKLSFTTTSVPAGTYRIAISYGWNHDSAGSDFEAQFLEDTVVLGEIHKQEPKDSAGAFSTTGTSQRQYTHKVHYSTLTAGTHTYDFDFRTDTLGTASSVWEVIIEFWRVA